MTWLDGSSPHTRGAPVKPLRSGVAHTDHPRIRGEHVLKFHVCGNIAGIIPAYAGSTYTPTHYNNVI